MARATFVVAAVVVAPGITRAEMLEDDGGGPTVTTHGFVSQGALKSTDNNYLARSKRGSLEYSEVGINFTSQLTDRLRVGLQLFARDLGPVGNYSAKTDWYYLDYRWRDWFGIRAGRVKVPFGLYNDTSDIDAAHVPILLPQSVYPINDREFLLAQTGVEAYGYLDLRGAGALEYRAYGGTIYLPATSFPSVQEVDVPYLVGGRLMWETPVAGLRIGGSAQALRLNLKYQVPGTAAMPMPTTLTATLDAYLGVASAELTRGDLTVAAEFSQWRVELDAATVMATPGAKRVTVSDLAYVFGAYHLKRWLWPGVYYSMMFPDEANATFTGHSKDMQHDVASTLRFDINAHWLVKLEAHYMHGTAGLDPALNGGAMRDTLTRDWAVFLAKTTAYF